ncbi:MAG TPA: class I SAM-dependent methyltransferase [Roseiflexaceae bacterium]|nr:class I SAM-dependent methyltransferase [Roseiflexaceae bacterium]
MAGAHHDANIERFNGIAALYDSYRPQPPEALPDILVQLAGGGRPDLVVDLGSGSGLSTRLWAGRAARVVGVEPGEDMRHQAEARNEVPAGADVSYRAGTSDATGLPNGCADIVTISQALHWMEPGSTFAEVARILRPGGVFAAYDCDWPPTVHWEAEAAYMACAERAAKLEDELGLDKSVRRWAKSGHLERIRASGLFRYVKEITLHNIEQGGAGRLVGLALSQGGIAGLLKHGVSESAIGLDTLYEVATRTISDQPRPWYFSYRVRIGVR